MGRRLDISPVFDRKPRRQPLLIGAHQIKLIGLQARLVGSLFGDPCPWLTPSCRSQVSPQQSTHSWMAIPATFIVTGRVPSGNFANRVSSLWSSS